MRNPDQAIRELLDREAIRDLPVRYCDCVWREDSDGVTALFTEDGLFVYTAPDGRQTSVKGTDHLHKFFDAAARGNLKPRPFIHNHVVELLDAEHATGRCYVDLRAASNKMGWLGAGYYHDEYRKVGDDWKLASRIFHAVEMVQDPLARRKP